LIEQLVLHDDVYELAKSIAFNNFFPSEPLVVVREDRKLMVIEGNRRLAACKLLLSPEAAPEDFRDRFRALAAKVDQNSLRAIPIVIAPSRGKTVPLVIALSWFSVKWRVAVSGKLLNSAAARREFSRHRGLSFDEVFA
jgi:hypothetical protein